jgi:hypothetical protein
MCCWLKIVANVVGSGVPVCCGEFSMHQTAIFVTIYDKVHDESFFVLVNKNVCLQMGLVDCIRGAEFCCG